MSEIKSHPWFLKNLPRELKEEAQAAYYTRRGGDAGAGAATASGSSNNANATTANGGNAATYSAQSVEEIMRIVQEAQTLPRGVRSGSGYGWGASDDDDEAAEQDEEEEEDDYDRTVRQVHASGDLDMSKLHI